ncbi:RTA1-domain-containing protein [Penicillium argentinense]|uniref:RTA1-domain-containing protein n=1 Tax=Penicillium argentinense TaxID=1131581 RepID=A0A9W9KB11_9EURO|nr:RTA1-domain-containing protein [Penicillium argentinense]KAJ5099659.1 RTA1-domain-containing protein [Penicillium argentinense]
MSQINTEGCTLTTCPMDWAYIKYLPNVPANAFFLALFGVLLAVQLLFGIRFKTWTYTVAMVPGLILEVLGYVGRVMMHNNPFNFTAFLLYLIPLTIAPAFFTAGIYLCLGRIVIIYGEQISRIRPRTYTIIFVSCDILALILQAAGGAITSIAQSDEQSLSDAGVNIMIAGLAFQVASLTLFIILAGEFALRVRRSPEETRNEATDSLRHNWKWKMFLLGLAIAILTIFTRSIFRVAELKGGFDSSLANDEVALMVLESTMIAIACISMTGAHPAVAMGHRWKEFTVKPRKNVISEEPKTSLSGSGYTSEI